MNGPINGKLVLDSNIIINFFNKKIDALPGANETENPPSFIAPRLLPNNAVIQRTVCTTGKGRKGLTAVTHDNPPAFSVFPGLQAAGFLSLRPEVRLPFQKPAINLVQ
jgi:hypothetical protein